jgi:hypothetical protein
MISHFSHVIPGGIQEMTRRWLLTGLLSVLLLPLTAFAGYWTPMTSTEYTVVQVRNATTDSEKDHPQSSPEVTDLSKGVPTKDEVDFIANIPPAFLARFPLYLAIAVGIATFVGALITAFINWLNARAQRKLEKEKWTAQEDRENRSLAIRQELEKFKWFRERQEKAYTECLNYLVQSRTVPLAHYAGGEIDVLDFLGRMQTLQYVPVWATILEAYSSSDSKAKIRDASSLLMKKIDNARKAAQEAKEKGLETIPDNGFTEAIDTMLGVIIACTKSDLS